MSCQSLTINIDSKNPESVRRALETEWLLTNGLGGYAMGTALGVNTRRYHGLLVAAAKPPVGRIIALHSLIEQLIGADSTGTERITDLSTQQFGEEKLLHPGGLKHLKQFTCVNGRQVRWEFQCGNVRVVKTLSTLADRNAIMLHYAVSGVKHKSLLRLRPFTPLRDYHSLTHHDAAPCEAQVGPDGILSINRGDHQMKWFGPVRQWKFDPQWWRNFAYSHDQRRGQDWLDDQWSAGFFDCIIHPNVENQISLAISTEASGGFVAPPSQSPIRCTSSESALEIAADQFIVKRCVEGAAACSVIAGYPWFGDWGRDTMIALPGLMLCTGRLDEARSTLLTFARHLKNGLIPNLFDDYGGAAHYNTVDAPLWFVHAVHALWKSGPHDPNQTANQELISACREIINAYRRGTDFNIRMDSDGLIAAGDESTQLTWMDAKRDGVVFTPRHGKAVEINALWFNALHCLAEMTDNDMERRDSVALAETVASSFREQFWWPERNCLFDVIGNTQLRPNQILAVSLPHSPLEKDQQRAIVTIVGDRLLTPFGLRTLDRDDPNYRPRYEGNLLERDRAYHNGTVWPWLIGPYCEALLRVNDFNAAARRKVRRIIQPMLDEMTNTEGERCIGQIAEVYDGDPPHRPSGCPAQAWSVAEVLRTSKLVE